MDLIQPGKLIIGSVDFGTTVNSQYFSSGSSVYNGVSTSYISDFTIIPQQAGFPDNQLNYNLYNATDIQAGFKYAQPTGKIFTVISVTATTDTNATIELEDTGLYNYVNSVTDPPINYPDEATNGIFFEYINGTAKLGNLVNTQGAFTSLGYWLDDVYAQSINNLAINGGGGNGSSGTNGTSGTSGTSGEAGSSGTSGTSGESGTSGSSGTSGNSGTDGSSGTSGDSLFVSGAGFYYTTNDIQISGSLVVSDYVETSLLRGTGSIFLQPDLNDSRDFRIYNTDPADIHIKGNAAYSFFGDDTNYLKIDDSAQTVSIVGVNGLFVSGNIYQTGSLYVDGTLTAREIHTSYVTSSVLYQSGSTKFGDTQDDTHVFTGSMVTSGSLTVNGDLTVNGTSILKAIDNRESLIVSGAMNIVSNNVNASVVSASLAFESVKAIEQIINTTTMDLGYF